MSGSIQSRTTRSGSKRAASGGLLHLVALVAERGRDGVDDRRLVVDDQDPVAGSRLGAGVHAIKVPRLPVSRLRTAWESSQQGGSRLNVPSAA
jgi:hypothetical protein